MFTLLKRMRATLLAAALITGGVAAPAWAQSGDQPPDGWLMRADRAGADMSEVFFVDMPPGWHVTTGPAGILYDPEMTANGDFRMEMEVYLFDPQGRRESFGFFVGGSDLQGDGQEYLYFLIREGGEFIIKTRGGASTATIQPWTGHPSVNSWADRGEGEATALNTLALERTGDELSFQVNGQVVATVPVGTLPVDGIVGMRVNHRLNLHVSRLEVTSD